MADYSSSWQRHKDKACAPDCYYCVTSNKLRRSWFPLIHVGQWTRARAKDAAKAREVGKPTGRIIQPELLVKP